MYIELIDYGGKAPDRAHYNDAGADVFARVDEVNCDSFTGVALEVKPHTVRRIPLGIGLKLPDGLAAFVMPRSGKASNEGLTAEIIPIDSGYTGEIHAIVYNATDKPIRIYNGDKIAQLVITPVVLAAFSFEEQAKRGDRGFGSTGDR